MSSTIIYHRHHIVPRYLGGANDPSNIIRVNPKMHAFLHWQLYKENKNWQDLRACIGILGLNCTIEDDDPAEWARKQKIKQYWEEYRQGKHPKRTVPNKDKPMSEAQKKKLRKPKSEAHKQALRKPKSDSSKMGKYERTPEIRKKISDSVNAYLVDK